MKRTIRRLIISPRPITKTLRKEQLEASELMRVPDVLEIVTEFLYIPGILDKLEVESDKDISNRSIRKVVARHGYFNVHLVLNDSDWKKMGLRSTLWGQSQEIDGQAITYGRWSQSGRYKVAKKHKETFINSKAELVNVSDFSEASIGAWHELDHSIRSILKIQFPVTHYHFYGWGIKFMTYTKAQERKNKPRRYVRKTDPLAGWRALPFEKLPLNKWQANTIKLTLWQKIFTLFVDIRIKEEQEILEDLQPAVKRKAEALIEAMAREGYFIDITSGYRGEGAQNALYAKGRTAPGNIVTNAKFGDSLHNYGVAFDVAFIVNGKPSWSNKHPWDLLGETGEALGLEWGGRWTSFVDRPHMEYKAGYTLRDFKNKKVNYKKLS